MTVNKVTRRNPATGSYEEFDEATGSWTPLDAQRLQQLQAGQSSADVQAQGGLGALAARLKAQRSPALAPAPAPMPAPMPAPALSPAPGLPATNPAVSDLAPLLMQQFGGGQPVDEEEQKKRRMLGLLQQLLGNA